jgi:large subunit ribosomal protein L23
MRHVIIRPVITEKSLAKASTGWYTLAVAIDATKEEICSALRSAYKVDVVSIRTMRVAEKIRRVGKRMTKISKSEWKKTLVKLKSGQKLDMYESVINQLNK